jgi:hypothetical protein
MTRAQLEHLIRAAAVISTDNTIVVVGSQAILGQFPEAPASMRVSMEADLFPFNLPERADVIDGSIGELSPFHQTFGYYAHAAPYTTTPSHRAFHRSGVNSGTARGASTGVASRQKSRKGRFSPVL